MIDGSDIRRGAPKDRGLPRICVCLLQSAFNGAERQIATQMRIKVDDRNGSVSRINRTQKRKNNGVITTEGNDTRVVFTIDREGRQGLASRRIVPQRRVRFAVQQRFVPFFNLFYSDFVVVGPMIIQLA